jgi:TDG/mug DNA glycosylase family protein
LPRSTPPRPTPEELKAASSKFLRDVIGPDLKVLFSGINPGLYSTAIGHHFGRPGNRFWPALHLSGFTPRLFSPYEDTELLELGYGITNVVARTTAKAEEITKDELLAAASVLTQKLERYRPRFLAICGMGAYRTAFGKPKAGLGEQSDRIAGTRVWVLPNPSGLNANFQLPQLAELFAELRRAACS